MNKSALVLALLLISAGCAGQDGRTTSLAPETTTTESEVGISVEGAPFPVESDTVFRRVEALLDQDLTPPTIRVLKIRPDGEREDVSTDAFSRRMGITRRQSLNDIGGNTHRGVVRIFYTENSTAERMEQVLAHEFVHVGQPRRLRQRLAARQGSHSNTTDAEVVREAVAEGSAVYVANRYTKQYLSNVTEQATYPEWNSFGAGTKWHFAPYYFGSAYVRNRVDAASNVTSVYARPPNTTEQLLHGSSPDSEPPQNLTVDVQTEGSPWLVERSDTKGELFVRVVLAEQLDESRATTAAAGWGNDRVVTLRSDDRMLHAWAVRWDDEQNATQFETAAAAYLDGRATERDGVWTDGDLRTDADLRFDLRRVDSTTVVLLAGNASVRNVDVTASDGTVTVRPNSTQ